MKNLELRNVSVIFLAKTTAELTPEKILKLIVTDFCTFCCQIVNINKRTLAKQINCFIGVCSKDFLFDFAEAIF